MTRNTSIFILALFSISFAFAQAPDCPGILVDRCFHFDADPVSCNNSYEYDSGVYKNCFWDGTCNPLDQCIKQQGETPACPANNVTHCEDLDPSQVTCTDYYMTNEVGDKIFCDNFGYGDAFGMCGAAYECGLEEEIVEIPEFRGVPWIAVLFTFAVFGVFMVRKKK